MISGISMKMPVVEATKRVSSGFESFKRKNNMMVEEELRTFVGFYQKRANL